LPVFTSRCACCRQPGTDLCRPCRFALASSRSSVVAGHDGPPVLAALQFEGAVRRAILGLKFANQRAVARHLAELVVRRLSTGRGIEVVPEFDVVTWAPTSSRRARRRGYDQAQVLARHVARQLGVPCQRLLWRQHGAPQAGRGRAERLSGPSFRGRPAGAHLRVLLVDDVVTTGSTLHAAAAALRAAGVGHVTCVAVAATPQHGVRRVGPPRTATPADRPPGRLDAA
ncbi:MAG: ComF family protein, partial [Actinobacteria bacterium]|nr:ComF family protein [Actinomycetota bacterium]